MLAFTDRDEGACRRRAFCRAHAAPAPCSATFVAHVVAGIWRAQNDPRECSDEARDDTGKAIDAYLIWHGVAKEDKVFPDVPLVDGTEFWVTRIKHHHLVLAAGAEKEGREKLGAPPDFKWDYDLERALARLDDLHTMLSSDRVTKYYYDAPLQQARATLSPHMLSRCMHTAPGAVLA